MTPKDKNILRIAIGVTVLIVLVLVLSFPAAEYYRQSLGKERGLLVGYSLSYLHQLNQPVERLIFGFNQNPYSESYITPKEIRDKYRKVSPELTKDSASKKESCWLKRKTESGEEDIFNSPGCSTWITSWKGYLIFSEWKDQNTRLIALEPKRGTKKVLYDFFESQNDFEGAALEFTSLQVINNKLYFSIGGYAAASAIYVVENPEDVSSRKLLFTNRASSSIEYDDGRYWIVGGMGDAGEGFSFRMTFDPVTNKIGSEIRTAQNLAGGERYLGSSKTEAYIAKFEHKNPENRQFSRIKEIYTRNLLNPEKTRTVLIESSIYPGTKDAVYDAEEGKLYLLTDDVLVNAVGSSGKFTEVMRLEPGEGHWLSKPNDKLCLTDTMELSLTKKQLIENKEVCQRYPDFKEVMRKELEGAHLPSGYHYNF